MLLFELMNQPAEYSLVTSIGPLEKEFQFVVNDINYLMIVSTYSGFDYDMFASEFRLRNKQDVWQFFDSEEQRDVIHIEFGQVDPDNEYDSYNIEITRDQKNPLKVFATVVEIFKKEVLPHVKSGMLVAMTAKRGEQSRIRLYDRFAKQYNAVKVQGEEDVVYVMKR